MTSAEKPISGTGAIREQRRALGLRQEDLALMAGCSAGYIRMLERGFEPRFSDVLPRVLNALENPNQIETAEGLAA